MLTKSLSVKTSFSGIDFSKYSAKISTVVSELSSRANKPGHFLNWVNLPSEQLKRVDELYSMVERFKAQTGAKKLSVMGIGGSKHTVEHMLSINGLNICHDTVDFYSDVDSVSLNRYLYRLGDITSSNYMIASKSGSTFETKDGFLRIQQMLINEYMSKGQSADEAKKSAAKHFIAVTDANSEKSELRRTSISENWLGDLFIHDDVGGRFSAFDDHALFTLIWAIYFHHQLQISYFLQIRIEYHINSNIFSNIGIFIDIKDIKIIAKDFKKHKFLDNIHYFYH